MSTEPGYIPQRLSKHFWEKKIKIVQILAQRIRFYVVKWLYFGQTTKWKQPENKTAFETQVLWKYISEKGRFRPCI